MKRIILATAGVALFAVFAATLGSAQPTATTGPASADATPALPKLPADIASRKRFIIGVKCDTPPFGYLDVRGKNAGVKRDYWSPVKPGTGEEECHHGG